MTDVAGIVYEDLRRIREHSEAFLGESEAGDHNPQHLREMARLATRCAEAWEECLRGGDFSEWPGSREAARPIVNGMASVEWALILALKNYILEELSP